MVSLAGLRRRVEKLSGPAPMADFPDYDAYWEERGELGGVFHRWEVAADRIPDGARVLDVGCGSGEFLQYLRERRPNVRGVGADWSEQARTMTRAAGFEVVELDLSEAGPAEEFDYITAFEVVEHIPEAELAIRRLADAARRELIVSVPNVGYLGSRVRLALFGRFPVTNCIFHVKEHVRHWTPKDFADLARHLDLRIVHQEGQYGPVGLWRRWPALWAEGMVYVIDGRADR
jgi:methionine biosynthesis protein MetW